MDKSLDDMTEEDVKITTKIELKKALLAWFAERLRNTHPRTIALMVTDFRNSFRGITII